MKLPKELIFAYIKDFKGMVIFMKVCSSTSSLTGAIEEIVLNAEKELFLVSPYIKFTKKNDEMWSTLVQGLELTKKKEGTNIVFITRKPKKKTEETEIKNKLKKYAHKVWLVPDLHAKCYFNGNRALVSSMNLYYHSASENFEIGVDFQGASDEESLRYIRNYINLLMDMGEEILAGTKSSGSIKIKYSETYGKYTLKSENQEHLGFCIVCRNEIKLDINKPKKLHVVRCKDCWEDKKKGAVKGQFCHICGYTIKTSADKPACISCYRQIRKIIEV